MGSIVFAITVIGLILNTFIMGNITGNTNKRGIQVAALAVALLCALSIIAAAHTVL